jgi:hypothetical protein
VRVFFPAPDDIHRQRLPVEMVDAGGMRGELCGEEFSQGRFAKAGFASEAVTPLQHVELWVARLQGGDFLEHRVGDEAGFADEF